jgi:hypothetical protein
VVLSRAALAEEFAAEASAEKQCREGAIAAQLIIVLWEWGGAAVPQLMKDQIVWSSRKERQWRGSKTTGQSEPCYRSALGFTLIPMPRK